MCIYEHILLSGATFLWQFRSHACAGAIKLVVCASLTKVSGASLYYCYFFHFACHCCHYTAAAASTLFSPLFSNDEHANIILIILISWTVFLCDKLRWFLRENLFLNKKGTLAMRAFSKNRVSHNFLSQMFSTRTAKKNLLFSHFEFCNLLNLFATKLGWSWHLRIVF